MDTKLMVAAMPFSFWVIGPFDTSGNYWKISTDLYEIFVPSGAKNSERDKKGTQCT